MNPDRLGIKRRLALEAYRQLHKDLVRQHPLRQLFWECTQRCNLHCRHCGSDCKTSALVPDMPAHDFLQAVDQLLPHVDPHNLNIIITGGEPLVRADLEKVGLELYRRELPWGIVTNGLGLTPQRFDSLRRAGLHNITVSLDGLRDEHNWMRGNPRSYDGAINAIRMIAAAADLNSDVVTCVNRRTIRQLPQIATLLEDAGVKRWRLFTVFPSGRARGVDDFVLDRDQLTTLMQYIADKRKQGGVHPSFCCEGFLGAWEGEVRDSFYRCNAGVTVASVLADGSIAACPSIRADYVQGNIYRDNLWEVWQNRYQPYRDRQWMHTGICADCKHWRHCQGNGMHLREQDGSIKHCNLRTLTDRAQVVVK